MSFFRRRTLTRLAAVQALYLHDRRPDISIKPTIFFEEANNLQKNIFKRVDKILLSKLINGTLENIQALDKIIEEHLTKSWQFNRLDTVILAIFRASSFELLYEPSIPTPIIINEYIDIAHSFYGEGEEKKFVNGVLNSIACSIRSCETFNKKI